MFMDLQHKDDINKLFQKHYQYYGKDAQVAYEVPTFFYLLGEYAWFFKDKSVSMATNIPIYVAVSLRDDTQLNFFFCQLNDERHSNIAGLRFRKEDRWANALKAVIAGFSFYGYSLSGMDITVYSNTKSSSGLNIKASIKVALIMDIIKLFNFDFSINSNPKKILDILEYANKTFLKKENYLADNYTLLFTKSDNILVTNYATQSYDLINFNTNKYTTLLIDTNVPKVRLWKSNSLLQAENVLLLGELKDRRDNVYGGWTYDTSTMAVNEVLQVTSDEMHHKLLAVINEHHYVLALVDALKKNDLGRFMYNINMSHSTLHELYDFSCPEVDWVVKRVSQFAFNPQNILQPLACARMTGRGFGRYVYALLPNDKVNNFLQSLDKYEKIFGFKCIVYQIQTSQGVKQVSPK